MELCVATDLSPAAAPAVALAIDWARRLHAGVLLLHVVHDPVLAPAFTSDAPGDVVRARASLEELAAASGVPLPAPAARLDRRGRAAAQPRSGRLPASRCWLMVLRRFARRPG